MSNLPKLAVVALMTFLLAALLPPPPPVVATDQTQNDQRLWKINDEPHLAGEQAYWLRGEWPGTSGAWEGDYVYTYGAGGSASPENWAVWDMGSRWGRQEVLVYIPKAPADVRATVRYRIYANSDLLTNVDISQSQHKGWRRLGTYDFNGADVKIRVQDNETAEHHGKVGLNSSRIGIDAVAMRCIERCHDRTNKIEMTVWERVALLLSSLAKVVGEPVTPVTYLNGYPYEEFNCRFPPSDEWRMLQGQCTSYVAWRLDIAGVDFHNFEFNNNRPSLLPYRPFQGGRIELRAWSHARHWAEAARLIGITTDNNPVPGSVAQWGVSLSPYGHVAYVHAVKEDGTIVLHEMNYGNKCLIQERELRPTDAGWPDTFIHFERCEGNSCS